jgi:hypothetical protein
MELLLTVIVIWLSSNYDLPADMRHPAVEFVDQSQLKDLRHLMSVSANNNEELEAIYRSDTRTIYLLNGWTARSIKDGSVLVHEMVHHLQTLKSERYNCSAEGEKLAYEAQEKWLVQYGKNLEGELGLDPFSVLVKSLCN